MVKALSFTAASVFCLLSLVLNIERVLTLVRRPPPYSGDYGNYSGSRDYERDLQSMVRHVEPLMAILRNRQRDTEPSFNRMHEGISSNNIRNYDQHPASTNNLLSRLDQLANPMLNTQAALPFNRLGPGMSPGGGLANALAMLNPNAIKRYGGGGYGGGGYGGGYNGAYGGGGTCGVGSLCYGQNGQTGQFSTLGLVSIIATALLYLLFFYYISTSTTTTTTATGRRRKRAYQDEARQDLDYDFDFIDQQQDIGRHCCMALGIAMTLCFSSILPCLQLLFIDVLLIKYFCARVNHRPPKLEYSIRVLWFFSC